MAVQLPLAWLIRWFFPFGAFSCCRRRATVNQASVCRQLFRQVSDPGSWPCSRCIRRRLPKEKANPDDDEKDSELELGSFPIKEVLGYESPSLMLANSQDADEQGVLADVPGWQMPKLVVEHSQRPGARIHKGTSLILPEAGGDLMACIVGSLPVLLQIRPCWHLGYSMAVDGVSLRTMYRQLADAGPCVLIVEDSSNCIFGAFLSEGLRPVSQCYGTHECFVFRTPRTSGAWRTEVYGRTTNPMLAGSPTAAAEDETEQPQLSEQQALDQGFSGQKARYFEDLRKSQALVATHAPLSSASIFCNHTGIVVGIDGPALFIDQDLLRGVSWPSAAFGSPPLATAGTDFVVRNIEVWHWSSSE
eukprot:TRINITY_DN49976_c0_g1_i1.p1 TRINITY_DN49976_c0_g1~~TRINITY_DN49976_c0_g1_i1.p1  ORF type:complete len:383 (-),score=54.56 TRINITY_DN49976_c0_g1_i1:35-1117(-)